MQNPDTPNPPLEQTKHIILEMTEYLKPEHKHHVESDTHHRHN